MIIFDGIKKAAEIEAKLKQQVAQLETKPQVAAVLFAEDPGSRLYTRLKQEAAKRVGIGYQIFQFSILTPVEDVISKITELNQDQAITGIIIQKPTKQIYLSSLEAGQGGERHITYSDWWSTLVSSIAETKDVDGLHPSTLAAIADGSWQEQGRVLPATCQAVVDILQDFCAVTEVSNGENNSIDTKQFRGLECLKNKKIIILGKSDLLGKPLFYYLHFLGNNVEMIGSKELAERVEKGVALIDADVVISATGRKHLITGNLLKNGVALIDVGEPKPDVEFQTIKDKAAFITPVPGGVGPMTVVCLLQNAVSLVG